MTFRRGDVVLLRFPHSDRKTIEKRPALVVQANGLKTGIPQLVVAMISTNLSRLGHPSRVSISLKDPLGAKSGLLADSVVLTDNLVTVLTKAILRVLGRLSSMASVDAALRHTLAL